MSSIIATTNQKTLITDKVKNTPDTSILVVYKDKNGKHDEIFINETIDQIEEIYKNFNATLRPHESKRTPIAFYSVYNVVKLTKIK